MVIDPGHGGKDIGCTDDKISEKNITLAVAYELAQLLEMEGANVILTRNGDYQPGQKIFLKRNNDIDERIAKAKENNADIFVSLHVNSSPKGNRAGAVAFYNEDTRLGKLLAQDIQRELRYIPDMVKRTSRPRSYYILNHLEMPAVVVELGYITADTDRQHLSDPMYHKKMARSICKGINSYFNNSHTVDISMNSELPVYERSIVEPVENDKLPNLYFVPKTKTRLFMATEEMTLDDTAQGTVKELARSALEQLVEGPRQIKQLSPCIPEGISFTDLKISGPLATVDLAVTNEEPGFMGSEGEWIAISSIACTLFEFPEIQQVQILVNGKKRKTLAGHMDISKPLTRKKAPLNKIPGGIMEGKKAKVAIVIDDLGQRNPEGLKEMISIDRPMTFAVMPNPEYSSRQAVQAAKRGYEVIVHLPMQPVKGKAKWLGPGAITSNMTAEEIRNQVRRDFAQVPYATGFNNHMGSLITAREELIRPVLEVAREKGFYVLDSRTSNQSKIIPLAQSMGIAYTQRDVFLDDVKSISHMKKQLELLADEALAKGSAVGIGHVGLGGKKMARAIKDIIPVMEAKGIELVYLSELLH
ncbi:divergent polysaccharide deacetylase family protein [Desulfoscipio geothermicus]|uniref:divergent polysaccharide deacetylase family protein n=1 Tax=Desulfoscipio geothermicus TaxID=39060 RepID=UPI0013F4D3C6|nr:divergent polysaccharide deacetylase family protein [Desulfoscipio geothermicus]